MMYYLIQKNGNVTGTSGWSSPSMNDLRSFFDVSEDDDNTGECTTTGQCQQMYPGATDCRNDLGGVCYCGSQPCN
jgi:hypothetical protein